jgi:hypothetical protein
MASDPGYRTMCLSSDPVATQELPTPVADVSVFKAPKLWTSDQLHCLAIHILVIAGFAVFGMVLFDYDYLSLLWTHPTGIRIAISLAAQIILNLGLYLLLCAVLNHYFPPNQKDGQRNRAILSGLLATFQLIIFMFFVLCVWWVGPASIQITGERW